MEVGRQERRKGGREEGRGREGEGRVHESFLGGPNEGGKDPGPSSIVQLAKRASMKLLSYLAPCKIK